MDKTQIVNTLNKASSNYDELIDEQLAHNLTQKGTLGALWRWIMIKTTAQKELEKAENDNSDQRDTKRTIRDRLRTATLVEVPANILREGSLHCQEIAMRQFLDTYNVEQRTTLPSDEFKRDEIGETWETYGVDRESRLWNYPSEETVILLYDECVESVKTHAEQPNEESEQLIRDLYNYDVETSKRFVVSVMGHMLAPDLFVAFLVHTNQDNPGDVRVGVLTEFYRIDNRPTWAYPDSYAGDVALRVLKRLDTAQHLNPKISFKRNLQKVWKGLQVRKPTTIPEAYYQLDVVPLSLFHDVDIRRGYNAKSDTQDVPEPTPDSRRRDARFAQLPPLNQEHGHQAIVERFVMTRKWIDLEMQSSQYHAGIQAALRQARIIEIPRKFYWQTLEQVACHTYNMWFSILYKPRFKAKNLDELKRCIAVLKKEDPKVYAEVGAKVSETVINAPWKPELPFPVCYIGYSALISDILITHPTQDEGKHIMYSAVKELYNAGYNAEHIAKLKNLKDLKPALYAHLLDKDRALSLLGISREDADLTQQALRVMSLVELDPEENEGRWKYADAFTSLVLSQIMGFIADHAIVLHDQSTSKTHQRAAQKARVAQHKMQPPAYYTVYIKDGIYDVKRPHRIGGIIRKPPDYAYDRRGGTYYKVLRGPLPLDPKIKDDLEQRKYQVFETQAPWGEWAEAVKQRGEPGKRPMEWMAILKWTRRDTIVNQGKGLPYIPSVRRSEKHKEEDPNV